MKFVGSPQDQTPLIQWGNLWLRPGSDVVEAVVDPNEPPLPGGITTFQFTKALTRGQKIPWVSSKPTERRNHMPSLLLGCTIMLIGL